MPKRQRLRRPDPARTGPHRQFSTMFRRDDSSFGTGAGASSNVDDAIGDAVRMGYSVIEEQIRQGQRSARQMSGAAPGMGAFKGVGSMTDIANRLLRYSTDLASLHFDLMTALLHSSQFKGVSDGFNFSQNAGSRVILEVESGRKNKVSLDLWAGAAGSNLRVPALYSANADTEPLTEIGFTPGTEQSPARLTITVPDTQAAGTYSGLILDANSGQAAGTLSLTLYD